MKEFEDLYQGMVSNSQDLINYGKNSKKAYKKFKIVYFLVLLVIIFILITLCVVNKNFKEMFNNNIGLLMILLFSFSITIYIVETNKLDRKYHKLLSKLYFDHVSHVLFSNFSLGDFIVPININNHKYYDHNLFAENGSQTYDKECILPYKNVYMGNVNSTVIDIRYNNKERTTFKGLAGIILQKENYNHYFIVVSKSNNNSKVFDGREKIKIDSEEFLNYFDILTDDEVFTYGILTSDVIEKITNIQKKYSIPFEFAIQNNGLYFRIYNPINILAKPENFSDPLNKEIIHNYYNTLGIVSELNKLFNEQVEDYKTAIVDEAKEMITLKKEEVDSEIPIP